MDADAANPSYKVDLNIPAECVTFRIIIKNNVYDLKCKSGLTTKLLNGRIISKEILTTEKKVVFTVEFTPSEAHIFNYLLDRSDLSINELFDAVYAARKFFEEYDITCKSQTSIDKYIASLSSYQRTWTGLTTKPDYNLTIFSNRMLPYFSLECMDWVKANLDTLKGDYPAELLEAKKKHEIANGSSKDDYHEEMSLATRNNNFLEWQVLPLDKYPDMDNLINRIQLLMKIGLKRQAIVMICKLMLSPRECHIVKRPEIWEILMPEMTNKDFDILIKYCMYYALYIMRQEETIMFSQVNTLSRVLFKLEEANKLPSFGGCHIDRNPYIIQLTNDTPLGQCMPFYLHGKRRLNSKQEFQRRFDIATGGAFKGFDLKSINAAVTGSILIPCVHRSPLEDGFEDVEWVRDRETVELKFPYMTDTPVTQEDVAFANYLEYYYPSYVSLTDDDYKKQVLGIGDKLKPNERHVNPNEVLNESLDYEDGTLATTQQFGGIAKASANEEKNYDAEYEAPKKKAAVKSSKVSKVTVSKKLATKKVIKKLNKKVVEEEDEPEPEVVPEEDPEDSGAELDDVQLASHEKPDQEIQEDVEDAAQDADHNDVEDAGAATQEQKSTEQPVEKKEDEVKILDPSSAENKTQRNATEYNQLADIDISITTRDQSVFKERALQLYEVIRKNCQHRGAVHIKEVKTIASVKYKIYGPGISRPMDIFRIPYDPVKMVKKFHVHAVKMFYDGNVTMFRSCVSCLLSGVGENYKWFSCNKVPADVLLKYAQRGITIILNSKEREAVSKYIMSNERWGNVLTKLGINPTKIYCCATAGHPFFRPGMYDCGIRLSLRKFERDSEGLYANTLTVPQHRHVYPYGEVLTHDAKKIYMPDVRLINSILDHIENGDAVVENADENLEDGDNDVCDVNEDGIEDDCNADANELDLPDIGRIDDEDDA